MNRTSRRFGVSSVFLVLLPGLDSRVFPQLRRCGQHSFWPNFTARIFYRPMSSAVNSWLASSAPIFRLFTRVPLASSPHFFQIFDTVRDPFISYEIHPVRFWFVWGKFFGAHLDEPVDLLQKLPVPHEQILGHAIPDPASPFCQPQFVLMPPRMICSS